MKRAFDHLVLAVRDLEAARAFYARLGFTLTPPARHPFGTANSLVQLQGNFLELLAVAEHGKIGPAAQGHFSFAEFNRAFLAKREGMSMLVFASADARGDRREFLGRGLQTYEPFDFERKARLPDGSEATVGFSLAFVTEPRMPDAAFFVCQQHAPQHFWKPEFQRHPNGARAVVEVTMLASDPAAYAEFFSKLMEPQAVKAGEGALEMRLEGGTLAMLDATRLGRRFPGVRLRDVLRKPYFAGYSIEVADLAAAAAQLERNGVAFTRSVGRLHVAAEHAFGTVIELVPPR